MQVARYPTPNSTPGRGGFAPRAIVIHTSEGIFSSVVSWFADPRSRVSAHYLVALDGRVAQFVEEGNTAHHAGRVRNPTAQLVPDANPNLYTIGIEFEDRGDPSGVLRPDEQYRAGAALLRAISLRWGIDLDRDHVIGHREIYATKSCPGNVDIDRLIREAREGPMGALGGEG